MDFEQTDNNITQENNQEGNQKDNGKPNPKDNEYINLETTKEMKNENIQEIQQNQDIFQNQEIPKNQVNNNFEIINQNQQELDENELNRIKERENEEKERRQKIEEKIKIELEKKSELRNKAMEFMGDFEVKRKEKIEQLKQQNITNEKNNITNKQLMKEGKKNSWEIVSDNINIKESEYKGSNDISRMRAVILSRKNDKITQNI